MLTRITNSIFNTTRNYNRTVNNNRVSFGMKEDIYAKTRNGHNLIDTFDKTNNTFDIFSNGLYPSNVLSNLAYKPFKFMGVECSSMEGLLQSLKEKDPEIQREICKMYGGSAKNISKNYPHTKKQKLYWQGNILDRNSDKYQEFLYSAYLECYKQNDTFKEALNATKGKTLTHTKGKTDKNLTVLTSEEFVNILTKIRDGKNNKFI